MPCGGDSRVISVNQVVHLYYMTCLGLHVLIAALPVRVYTKPCHILVHARLHMHTHTHTQRERQTNKQTTYLHSGSLTQVCHAMPIHHHCRSNSPAAIMLATASDLSDSYWRSEWVIRVANDRSSDVQVRA